MAEEVKEIKVNRKERKIGNIAPEIADRCYTCGTCSGGCPATGLVPIEGGEGTWDARKAIRAMVFGLEQEVIDSKWPWVCTMCGRCEYQCPMGINSCTPSGPADPARAGQGAGDDPQGHPDEPGAGQ